MNRCCSSGSQGHVMGSCTCGMFHSQASSFSMLFSMPNHHKPPYDYDDSDMYDHNSPSSSSIDCTLSLGTPSTRFSQDEEKRSRHQRRFCWDLLQSKHNNPQSHSNSNSTRTTSSSTTDPLLARRCANCDTTSTPLWRNGPRGPKSLCNACGIRFKKEERRAAAATSAAAPGGVMESAQVYNNSWYVHQQSQKMQCFSPGIGNDFRFVDDADREPDNAIPFLSWRLNVTDRTSLVHDFTR